MACSGKLLNLNIKMNVIVSMFKGYIVKIYKAAGTEGWLINII